MTKRKNSTLTRPALADGLLEEEVRCASAFLDASCGWAVNLSEAISGFDDSFVRIQGKLEELTEELRRRNLDESTRRKVRKILTQIRKYSRTMADENEPLRVVDIIESAQQIFDLEKKLKRLMSCCFA